MRIKIFLFILLLLLISGCISNYKENKMENLYNVSLIPKELIFGNPDRISPQISPNGNNLSFIAPANGVLNVWVGPIGNLEKAKPVTNDTFRGIRTYGWTYNNEHIIYIQDKNGDENWRIYVVNLSSDDIRDLTPFDGVQARIQAISPKFPDEIVIALNKRNPQYHDIYKLNILTGNMTLLTENNQFTSFDVDDELKVRLASEMTQDGGLKIFKASNGEWEQWFQSGNEDSLTTSTLGFDKNNNAIYMKSSRGRETAALYTVNLTNRNETLIAQDPKADVSDYMIHPTEKNVQAVAFTYDRKHWKIIDPAIEDDMKYLRKIADGDIEVTDRTLDDRAWIVAYLKDNGPVYYYYYDRDKKRVKFLFTNREKLEGKPLAKMIPTIIKSRDNLSLMSYYTLPLLSDKNGDGKPDKPLPMVLYIHGGPWARDTWGYNPIHQWLANRGYAVLSVNYRGSTGFGKNFTNAGNKEWGGKMQDDLVDAVNWSIQQGIADPKKVAIMGGSYGGYATLAGLTLTPQVFACGVDIVGVSNLTSFMESTPAYWQPMMDQMITRIGDFKTQEGRKLLKERSPINHIDRIQRPLLIGQGANDPRVNKTESDQIVNEMLAKSLPVTYVLYPDEGHGFARPKNQISFFSVTEAFLAQNLGGRYEPIGNDFSGSSIAVPVGAQEIPGLVRALQNTSNNSFYIHH